MHAIELLPDAAGCEAVRRDWQALRDAGLPSQLDHRGATNSPHVTAVAAPALGRTEEAEARAGPHVPLHDAHPCAQVLVLRHTSPAHAPSTIVSPAPGRPDRRQTPLIP